MTQERPQDARETFAARAPAYGGESTWVTDESLIDPLLEGLAEGEWMADVCSGTGTVGRRAASLGLRVCALDLSLEMLHQSSIESRIVCSGSALPLKDRSVGRVVCRQGLHYLPVPAALRGFARAARDSVAIGTITMLDEGDRDFWDRYFDIASPGRLTVFAPGQVQRCGEQVGLKVDAASVIEGRGSLLGPIRHLPRSDTERLKRAFLDPGIAERYQVVEEPGDLTYVQRWEFIRFATSGG